MRILIVGGEGMVGQALAWRLARSGHQVTISARRALPSSSHLCLDLVALPDQEALVATLRGFDLLINAAGVGPSRCADEHERVHRIGACRLFDACVTAGVARVIQISALGDPATGSFLASKHAADAYLLALPIAATVIRPSLIFSRRGESSRLLLALARLPLLMVPDGGRALVQPVHVDDLVDAIGVIVASARPTPGIVEIVGPRAISLERYIQGLRRALGLSPALTVTLPGWLARIGFRILGCTGSSVGGGQTLRVLRAGCAGSAAASRIGRPPEDMLSPAEAREESDAYARGFVQWSGRLSVGAVCLASALTPVFAFDHVQPIEWLGRLGLHGPSAWILCVLLVGIDLTCAWLAITARSAVTWAVMTTLFIGYTGVMSICMPALWLDPFGPLLKNIPLIAWTTALAALARIDDRRTS